MRLLSSGVRCARWESSAAGTSPPSMGDVIGRPELFPIVGARHIFGNATAKEAASQRKGPAFRRPHTATSAFAEKTRLRCSGESHMNR